MSGGRGVGIPIKLMHEAEGHTVTVGATLVTSDALDLAFVRHTLAGAKAILRCPGEQTKPSCFSTSTLECGPSEIGNTSLTAENERNPKHCLKQVELKTGETYRGELAEAEDNWNCQVRNVTATARVSGGLELNHQHLLFSD